MNIKKILVAVYALSTTIAFAQEQRIKEESKTIFKPHWFIQAQIGAAHTVGEGEFTDLISPAAALNVGYKFAPAFCTCRCKWLAGKGGMGQSTSELSV